MLNLIFQKAVAKMGSSMQENYWGNSHDGERGERQGEPSEDNVGLTSVIRRGRRKESGWGVSNCGSPEKVFFKLKESLSQSHSSEESCVLQGWACTGSITLNHWEGAEQRKRGLGVYVVVDS